MKRTTKWAAIALIVVGGAGLALNFSDLRLSGPEIDQTAAIAPDHVQQAGSSASASAVVENAEAAKDNNRWAEVRKRWEFKSGAFKNLSLTTGNEVHIEVEPNAQSDYLEVRGAVSAEAAKRAMETSGESDGIKLDLSGKSNFRLISLGANRDVLYVKLGLRDAAQLENAEFSMGSGSGRFGDFYAKNLSLKLSSGELDAQKLSGEQIALSLTSGNVQVDQLIGQSRIELSSGVLDVDALEGDSVVRASSGIVNLTQRKSGNLDVQISSGEATVRPAEDFKGVYDLHVTSGLLNAPESPGSGGDTIKVRATSGVITVKPQ